MNTRASNRLCCSCTSHAVSLVSRTLLAGHLYSSNQHAGDYRLEPAGREILQEALADPNPQCVSSVSSKCAPFPLYVFTFLLFFLH